MPATTRPLFLSLALGLAATAATAATHLCPGGQHHAHSLRQAAEAKAGRSGITHLRWGGTSQQHITLTYSFVEVPYTETDPGDPGSPTIDPVPDSGSPNIDSYNDDNGTGVRYPDNARDLVRQAFATWSASADLTFVEVADDIDVDIRVGAHAFDDPVLGHGFFPGAIGDSGIGGDLHLDNSNRDWLEGESGATLGRTFFRTALHEIGHALGLDHIVDDAVTQNVVMYAQLTVGQEGPAAKDVAYLQDVYGAPIPAFLVGSRSTSLTWTFPVDPISGAGQTPHLAATLVPQTVSSDPQVNVTVTTTSTLQNFEVRRVPLALQTFSDGAEPSDEQLFDTTILDADSGFSVWERVGGGIGHGSTSAYRIDGDSYAFDGTAHHLPLLDTVDIEGTSTTRLRFSRSHRLSDGASAEYQLFHADGSVSNFLATANGSGNGVTTNYGVQDVALDVDGESFGFSFIFNSSPLGVFFSEFMHIDDVEIIDVLAPSGDFASATAALAAGDRSFSLAGEPAGTYRYAVRGLYQNAVIGADSETVKRVNDGSAETPAAPALTVSSANVARGTEVVVDIALDAGTDAGENADWWVLAQIPGGTFYYYHVGSDGWRKGLTVTHQGGLFDLGSFEVLRYSSLPVGTTTFYFGVDFTRNGNVTFDSLIVDQKTVTVSVP
jgi:hypothetical protein